MDHGDGRFEFRIRQIEIVIADLSWGEHPLVHYGPGGQAADIELLILDRPLGFLPEEEQLPLQGLLPVVTGDEHLHDGRFGLQRQRSGDGMVHGNGALAYQCETSGIAPLPEYIHACGCTFRVLGEEDQSGAVPSGLGDLNPALEDEPVGNLQRDARTVAGATVRVLGATMCQILQYLESLLDYVVALGAVDPHDHPDPAGVLLVRGIVEAACPAHPITFRISG